MDGILRVPPRTIIFGFGRKNFNPMMNHPAPLAQSSENIWWMDVF
jgi:hypothetical protein